jgi:hypothetical protein
MRPDSHRCAKPREERVEGVVRAALTTLRFGVAVARKRYPEAFAYVEDHFGRKLHAQNLVMAKAMVDLAHESGPNPPQTATPVGRRESGNPTAGQARVKEEGGSRDSVVTVHEVCSQRSDRSRLRDQNPRRQAVSISLQAAASSSAISFGASDRRAAATFSSR